MNTLSLKADREMLEKIDQHFREWKKENPNPYISAFYQGDDVTISVYTSGKVVFQGKNAHVYGAAFLNKKIHDEAGSDEVGTGDYFGPVCVCACILRAEDQAFLERFAIDDSKQLSDEEIRRTAPELMKVLPYSLLILKPAQYNQVYPRNNMVAIKAKMHNQAYVNLKHKGYAIPKAAYVDQFVAEDTYYRYLAAEKEVYHDLIFETKAESAHPAVACASMIARYAFLREMDALSEKVGFPLHKGAGDQVDLDGLRFAETYGLQRLPEVAKMHFRNTQKIRELLEEAREQDIEER
ncbi:MAG: ribonuclease HIII [Erysipelotrichaceae bacterium]|nr:ribonuclease HIII [Erysipelotrichaceae bacterium]